MVSSILDEMEIPNAVVGAMALSAHGYARGTQDFDLGVVIVQPHLVFDTSIGKLPDGFESQYRLPENF